MVREWRGKKEKQMATIKEMIIEKIRQQCHGTLQQEDLRDENVRKELEKYLHVVCLTLPGENDPDKNPEGANFAAIMFRTYQDLHDAAVNKIIEMIMDERNDLIDYKPLRQKIEKAIAKNCRDLYDGVSYKDMTMKATDGR